MPGVDGGGGGGGELAGAANEALRANDHDARGGSNGGGSVAQGESTVASDGLLAGLMTASPTTIASAIAVPVVALTLRTGWTSIILVPLCSILLLLNPWIRSFLELPEIPPSASGDSSEDGEQESKAIGRGTTRASQLAYLDPARFLGFMTTGGDEPQDEKSGNHKSKQEGSRPLPLDRSDAYAALRRMPAHLRTPLSDLEELIIRDCISTWYNYHSFGDDSLPNEARYSIDHAIGSVYAATENIKGADVVAELLLAAASVILVTLRYRRLYPNRAPIFSSDRARIQALREALDRVFQRHGRVEDGSCDILRVLLREIISKQVWNAVCGVGQADFINQKIVEWDEKNRSNGSVQAVDPPVTSGPYDSPYETRIRSNLPTHAYPTPANNDYFVATQGHNAAPQGLGLHPDGTQALSGQSPSINSAGFRLGSSSTEGNTSALPTSNGTSASASEPRTTQPKARTMPSAPGRTSLMSPSPRPELSPGSSYHALQPESSMPRRDSHAAQAPSGQSQGHASSSRANEQSDDTHLWNTMALPMNVPPGAHEQMSLPESLRKSLRTSDREGKSMRRSLDVPRSDNTGRAERHRSPVDDADTRQSVSAASSPQRPLLHLDPFVQGPTASRSDATSSTSPHAGAFSPAISAGSEGFVPRSRPPSRTASGMSGGIPPAPDLTEVLSSQPSATGVSGLRDAFEAFLERGGVANRSLFFSPPSAATVAPGEGEALLKLHVGLIAIARLVPSDVEHAGEAYRDDAASIVHKAFHALTSYDDGIAGRPLRDALAGASNRLRISQSKGGGKVREVLLPVETALWQRLTGLYEHFWKETCTRPSGGGSSGSGGRSYSGAVTPLRGSTAQEVTDRKRISRDAQPNSAHDSEQLAYIPRKKASLPTIKQQRATPATSSRDNEREGLPIPGVTPARASTSVYPIPSVGVAKGSDAADSKIVSKPEPRRAHPEHQTSEAVRGPEITLTDVSPNAEQPNSIVDPKQYEAMIAVEGLLTESGGFMLLRHWKDFVQLSDDLAKTESLPPTPTPLPDPKGKGSALFAQELENYLRELLASPDHITSEALQHFVDKARGGEGTSENRFGTLLDSMQLSKGLGLGRSLATGVGNVGRTAFNTLQMVPSGVAGVPRLAGQMANEAFGVNHTAMNDDQIAGDAEGLASGKELAHLPRGARQKTRTASSYESDAQPFEKEASDRQEVAGSSKMRKADNIRTARGPRRSRSQESLPSSPIRTTGRATREAEMAPMEGQYGRGASLGGPGASQAPAKPLPTTDFSQTDLDNLLSILFAIADEAFNLSGGWTFRRGMLRVFEQIVRTQYWSSLLGVFNNLAHQLNGENIGKWCAEIKRRFWPDEDPEGVSRTGNEKGPVNNNNNNNAPADTLGPTLVDAVVEGSSPSETTTDGAKAHPPVPPAGQPAAPRTPAEKAATHAKAQAILLRRVPASSAYLLGPGGRQSCERAVLCMHAAVCEPSTSLDLVLTVVLKLCDVVVESR